MRTTIRLVMVLFAPLLVCSALFAQPTRQCDVRDFKDTSDLTTHQQSFFSYFFTTDESNFQERHNELAAGAGTFISGVPVDAFASWSRFDNWRSTVKQTLKYERSEKQDLAYLQTRLTPQGALSYRACMHAAEPLTITALDQTHNDVTFLVEWRAPPLVTDAAVGAIVITHSPAVSPLGHADTGTLQYSPVVEKYLTYTLTPNVPFHMQAETLRPGYSGSLDYLITKYKTCRIRQNGVEEVKTVSVSKEKPNAGKKDFAHDELLNAAIDDLKKEGHRDIKLVSEKYYPERENGHPTGHVLGHGKNWRYDRHWRFELSYDPVYKEAEHPLCGLEST